MHREGDIVAGGGAHGPIIARAFGRLPPRISTRTSKSPTRASRPPRALWSDLDMIVHPDHS
jgi:hypothetical protein